MKEITEEVLLVVLLFLERGLERLFKYLLYDGIGVISGGTGVAGCTAFYIYFLRNYTL